jgi:short-subunit dehydrogenase
MTQPCIAIIGAGPGMGAAIARRFGREGFRVMAMARKPQTLQPMADALRRDGIACDTASLDAADPAAVQALLGALAQGLYLSVLAYNAAGFLPAGVPSKVNVAEAAAALRVSCLSALAAAQAVLPKMRERGNGTLLFTGGGYALEPAAAMSVLGMGKAALRNLAFSLHDELRPQGIHAATVTICGTVQPAGSGGPFAADAIAEHYWQLHLQKPEAFERERTVR